MAKLVFFVKSKQSQLELGEKVESEHDKTFEDIKNGKIKNKKQFRKQTAEDHIAEDENYYTKLNKYVEKKVDKMYGADNSESIEQMTDGGDGNSNSDGEYCKNCNEKECICNKKEKMKKPATKIKGKFKKVMKEYGKGKLKLKGGKKVSDVKQAKAIAYGEQRKANKKNKKGKRK